VDLRELIGKECEIVVTVETGQDGKQFAKIVDVFALEGGSDAAANGTGVQGLVEMAHRRA
jgi:hypothetical protein